MAHLRVWIARLFGAFTRRTRDARLAEEMQAHLDALAAEHEARGLSPDDARGAAARDFGGTLRVVEAHRAQGGLPWIGHVAQDLGYGVRRMRAEPWFSAAVAIALAVGSAAPLFVFAAIRAINFSHPPFQDPSAVVSVRSGPSADVAWPDYERWRRHVQGLDDLTAFVGATFTLAEEARSPERVQGAWIAAHTFQLLGTAPVLGRDLAAADDLPGAPPVVLLGWDVWQRRFGAADVIGRVVRVDGTPSTIVGVMPRDMTFPLRGGLWRPVRQMPGLDTTAPQLRTIGVVGRLARGVGRDAARAELDAIAQATLGRAAADDLRTTVIPFTTRFLGRATDPPPLALMVAAALVLLVGCSTAATLLYARSAFRREEIAMRAALGASRRRLVAQLLVECGLLASLAAGLALAATHVALRRFDEALAGGGMPPWVRFQIDPTVAGFALALVFVVTVAGGLAPALRLTRTGGAAVPWTARQSSAAGTQRRMRALIALETAFTLALLTAAVAFGGAAAALARADDVVRTDGVMTARLPLGSPAFSSESTATAFVAEYVRRLRGRGELEGATIASAPPFVAAPAVATQVDDGTAESPRAIRRVVVEPGYFAFLGLTAQRGRLFDLEDDRVDATAAVVNEAFARRHFPGGDAVGRRLRLAAAPGRPVDGPWLTIVGVVPTVRQAPNALAEPVVYQSFASAPAGAVVMARGRDDARVAEILRDEAHALAPELVLDLWRTLEQWSETSRWTQRTLGAIAAGLGGLALGLAVLGVYAVTAYSTMGRVKEAGIRAAVGASATDLTWLFVRGAAGPVAIGVLVGLAVSFGAVRALGSLLAGTAPLGLTTRLALAAAVTAVVGAAALLPARRVARRDPLPALRCE